MNWTDITVLIILLVFIIIGVKNGFLYSIFSLFSYIISVIFAIKFYPVLSSMLQETFLYSKIKTAVANGIINQQSVNASTIKEKSAQTIIDGLKLPNFIKESLVDNVNKSNLFDTSKIVDSISGEIATLVINILSVILIYVIIRVAMVFIRIIIKTISKIPVFKQLDKTGGLILGAIEGVFVVYILCAILILFSAFPKFATAIENIEESTVAKHFYQNNFIVSWID